MKDQVQTQLHAAMRDASLPAGDNPYTLEKGWQRAQRRGFIQTGNPTFDAIVAASGADIAHDSGTMPGVQYTLDDVDEDGLIRDSRITLPFPRQFRTAADYIAGVAHELTHWTARRDVTARPAAGMSELDHLAVRMFGTTPELRRYAKEELVAEFGAALLLDAVGEDPGVIERAKYARGWLTPLADEGGEAVADAELDAERAVSWLLSRVGLTLA